MKDKNDLIEIIIKAIKLDSGLYKEMQIRTDAFSRSLTVVLISSVAVGIGSVGNIGIKGIIVGSIGALIAWFIWASIVYFISLKYSKYDILMSQSEFLKLTGFASAPGIIRILGFFPAFYHIAGFTGNIWMIMSMSAAVETIINNDNKWMSFKICFIGWILMLVASFVLGFAIKGVGL